MTDISPLYLPQPAVINEVIEENSQIRTFVLSFCDREYNEKFTYLPGQFMMVSVPHCGEAPISFSSTPEEPGHIRLSVRRAGRLTNAMHRMKKGDVVGLRGPWGNGFPLDDMVGRDLLFVAGGIGLAPLAAVIRTCIKKRDQYGRISIIYGSRTPSDIAFADDIAAWGMEKDVECLLTVDKAEPGWDGAVGLVTSLFDRADFAPGKQTALVCGPPLMIRAVLSDLGNRGFADEEIITTMERHMKCGVGVCRHCHMDGRLVCADGPVFSLARLRGLEVMELG